MAPPLAPTLVKFVYSGWNEMIQPGFNIVFWWGGEIEYLELPALSSFISKPDVVSSIFLNIFFKIVDVLVLSQLYNYFY